MEDIRRLIGSHLSLYPGMELCDCVLLLYQGEFGAGPGVAGAPGTFLDALMAELDGPVRSPAPGLPDCIPVGGGLCRVPLSALAEGPSPGTFATLCMRAAMPRGNRAGFEEKLAVLPQMADAGQLPWPPGEVAGFLARYREAGYPPPAHSARFTALYRPHYRLLDAASALALPLYAATDRALSQKPHVLVGIDGMSGAGKTALAAVLAEVYGGRVVHADHFFLRTEQRTPERLSSAGGNIDWERLAPVAADASDERAFSYRPYDCQSQALAEPISLPAARLTVLEGVYALHPAVGAVDVRVFLTLDADTQADRLWAREPGLWPRFEAEWLPMEREYFAAFGIREGCDVILDTGEL